MPRALLRSYLYLISVLYFRDGIWAKWMPCSVGNCLLCSDCNHVVPLEIQSLGHLWNSAFCLSYWSSQSPGWGRCLLGPVQRFIPAACGLWHMTTFLSGLAIQTAQSILLPLLEMQDWMPEEDEEKLHLALKPFLWVKIIIVSWSGNDLATLLREARDNTPLWAVMETGPSTNAL